MILFQTNRKATDLVLLILRLSMGIVMFPHGAQKMLGWFDGPGFGATIAMFGNVMHIPAFLAVLVILAEFAGSILLVVGAITRLAALAISVDMLVAVLMIHIHNGFFMNWTGQQKGEGAEYFIYAIAIGLSLIIAGAGRFSIDAIVSKEGATA